ncbi:MAG: hypothetical protein ABIZ80_21890 [Bryobacteraceae bacterium]
MTRIRAVLLVALGTAVANAQCVMCYRTAAAQQAERARMLNFGIIVMLIPPFLILGGFLYLIYRQNGKFASDGGERAGERPIPIEAGARQ